jgi:hypothetical protein
MLVDSIVVRGIFLFYGNKCKRSIAKRNKYKQKEEIMGHPTQSTKIAYPSTNITINE